MNTEIYWQGVYVSSQIISLTENCVQSEKCIVYYLWQFWHVAFGLSCVHFGTFCLLLHCLDGLCISHQQSVYERGNTLGIVSNIFCISVHNNEPLPLSKTAVVCKRDCFIHFPLRKYFEGRVPIFLLLYFKITIPGQI